MNDKAEFPKKVVICEKRIVKRYQSLSWKIKLPPFHVSNALDFQIESFASSLLLDGSSRHNKSDDSMGEIHCTRESY